MNTNKPKDYITKSKSASLLSKWGKMLDYSSDTVKPVTGTRNRINTAMMLESQEASLLSENGMTSATTAGSGVFGPAATYNANADGRNDNAYAQGDYRLPKILIPMVRRTFPELITNDLVGVQPMGGPVGLAYALRYEYDGEVLSQGPDRHTAAGVSSHNPLAGTPAGARANAAHVVLPKGQEAGYQLLDSRYSGVDGNAEQVTIADISTLQTVRDVKATAGTNSVYLLQTTGAVRSGAAGAPAAGEVEWVNGAAAPAANLTRKLAVAAQGVDLADQDFGLAALIGEYEARGDMPMMSVKFRKTAVEARTRRLAATWSIELEQDIKNQNGLDIDSEIIGAMSYELQAEIDREMIVRMIVAAARGGQVSKWEPAKADARWHMERSRDFYNRIIVEANRMAARNRRGAANFIIATPRVLAILEGLTEFEWVKTQGTINTQPTGIAKVGTLAGRFNVYRDTRSEVQNSSLYGQQGYTGRADETKTFEYALLGYKGAEYYDTGIIFCPYIPVMVQRTQGPNDMSPRVGLMTRYGVVDNIFGSELYYHLICVKGLGDVFDATAGQVTYY